MASTYDIGMRDGLFVTTTELVWYQWFIFFLNMILTPVLLASHAIHIYLLPCLQITLANWTYWFIFEVLPCSCLRFVDHSFTAHDSSIGKEEVARLHATGEIFEWRRLGEITSLERMKIKPHGADHITVVDVPVKIHKLFSAGITPEDIYQGELGDCWLLSALAALSEYPNKIMEIFLTDSYNPRGIYYAQLFNHSTGQFERIHVDDFIPCKKESSYPAVVGVGAHSTAATDTASAEAPVFRPLYTQPHGNEGWVLILEKIFAKFVGSYGAIDGGFPIYALHCLTGE